MKLLVISRLLHKTLSQNKKAPPFQENLRNQLASLRRTVLKRIDRRLASASSTADDIIEAMAAFCLATNSSSADVIRHFHQVRLDVIGNQLELADPSGENMLKALKLYIRTLQNTKILFSRRLSDALAKLKARPILTDSQIRGLDDLDIDVLERWVASDVRNFTPWIKCDEMSKSDAEKAIKQWSKQAFESFTKGCQKCLKDHSDLSGLISLRKKALDIWLSARSSTPTHSSLSVLEGIRNIFNGQLATILRTQASTLNAVGKDVSSLIARWDDREHASPRSLWDPSLTSHDYSDGAATFKQAIMDTLLGRNDDITAVMRAYHSWLASIEKSRSIVNDLRRTKWEATLDEDEDDALVDPAATLNDDDPRSLEGEQKSAVVQALVDLQSSFRDTVETFGTSNQSDKAAFMLRLIRDLRRDLPIEILDDDDFDFASDIVPKLQEILTMQVVAQTAPSSIMRSFHRNARDGSKKVPGRALWEGDPQLPVQPSPPTFKFLRRLMMSMEQQGPDLWNPSTVGVMKKMLSRELANAVLSAYENISSPSQNGSEAEKAATAPAERNSQEQQGPKPSEMEQSASDPGLLRDWKIQLLFDAFYLQAALATTTNTNPKEKDKDKDIGDGNGDGDSDKKQKEKEKDELVDVAEKIQDNLDSSGKEKIANEVNKAAQEYWKRTELLFGLLAG